MTDIIVPINDKIRIVYDNVDEEYLGVFIHIWRPNRLGKWENYDSFQIINNDLHLIIGALQRLEKLLILK